MAQFRRPAGSRCVGSGRRGVCCTAGRALLYGDVREIDPQGGTVGGKTMAGFGLRSLLLGKNMGQPGVFIPRRTYEALGGLDESLHFALDFEYFLRVWTAFPEDGAYIPKAVASSRVWEAAKTIRRAADSARNTASCWKNISPVVICRPRSARCAAGPWGVRCISARRAFTCKAGTPARLGWRTGRVDGGLAAGGGRMIRMGIFAWRQRGSYAV